MKPLIVSLFLLIPALLGGRHGRIGSPPRPRWVTLLLVLSMLTWGLPLAAGFATPAQAATTEQTFAWGHNDSGQLGDGSTTTPLTPEAIALASGISPTAVAAGYDYSLAIGSDGRLYSWGNNPDGELGDGSTTAHLTPEVITLAPGVSPTAIASAGGFHSLAIGSDGRLYAWGSNSAGELGDGSTTNHKTPEVVTLAPGVIPTAIASSGLHSLAIGSDGRLYSWGDNLDGELGDGSTTTHKTAEVVTLAPGVSPRAIAAGNNHSLAIGSDGRLYAWGINFDGELGDGSTTDHKTPEVVTLASGVSPTAISGGADHSLAIGSDGQLYVWGNGAYGELGDGGTTKHLRPEVIALASGVGPTAVAAGSYHSVAIGSDGRLYAWGFNGGVLGDGTTASRLTPVVITLASGVSPTLIAAGGYHNLAIGAVSQTTPTITWANPADMTYGAKLDSTQLDATASVPGTFAYTPALGTTLNAGLGQTLTVDFTPTDVTHYTGASTTVTINVAKATPTLTWASPADIPYGTALGSTQLNATANVPGSFSYSPAAGTVLGAGSGQGLTTTFTPTDSVDYTSAIKSVTINVIKTASTISWSNPAAITYGTKLGPSQLNATGSVPGTFTYTPGAGTVLAAGSGQTLLVSFTPTDATNYTTASKSVTITVVQATPTLTWATPADITYEQKLDGTQLDASADVPGSFSYSPSAGTVLGAGAGQTLKATFTPTDTGNYATAITSVSINVVPASPVIIWANPADIVYGTKLDGTQLDATASTSGTFVYTPAAGTTLNAGAGQTLGVTFTATDATNYTTATKSVSLTVLKATPSITWANPADVTYGSKLDSSQLSATASVPGTFAYTPASGTVLPAGTGQTLSTTFTPADTANYSGATAATQINVLQVAPVITWANPADITYGTKLGDTQLDASANVPGSFTYTPGAGTTLGAGAGQILRAVFTPNDTANYADASPSVSINVLKATPSIAWATPADIAYGTALGNQQLNATAPVAGAFTYTPASGIVLHAGNGQTLSVSFTPADSANFTTTSATVTINVGQATPTIAWTNPADIAYGTALGADQLNAAASVPGTFVYTPSAGTVLDAGANQALSVTFTPTDAVDYTPATATVRLNVSKATPTIAWSNPADITYGTALSTTQLDAQPSFSGNSVDGTFTYTPSSGTVLHAGNGQTLSVSFLPTDSTNFAPSTKSVQINVLKATPVLTWANPADITFGTALGAGQLNASASVPGSVAYTPATGTVLNAGSGQTLSVTFTPDTAGDYNTVSKNVTINVAQATPTITWPDPADITYGTSLGAGQLDAAANVPGTFVYTPSAGTVLNAGSGQTLSAGFTPTDGANYTPASATAHLTVVKATPLVAWSNPADITYGAALGNSQLDATSNVPGTLTYTPAAGSLLNAGNGQTLSVNFAPTDSANFNPASKSVTINVLKATPHVTWATPADIVYGTALGAAQLNATSNVPGAFAYTPASGTILNAGSNQPLSATFTPADTTNYTGAGASASINVLRANQTITFGSLSGVTFGHAPVTLTASASSGLPVSFSVPATDPCTLSGATLTITGAGTCHITASQAGGGNDSAAPSVEQDLSIAKAPTTLTVATTRLLLAQGHAVTLSATLTSTGIGLTNEPVTLTLGSQSCQGRTDVQGVAVCTIPALNSALGPAVVTGAFAGDANFLGASSSQPALVYATLASGSFVLGDTSVANAGTKPVTFAGSQWAKSNALSGGSAPNSFKGFASSFGRSGAVCGGTWTASPGDSGSPPSSVPAYMAVVVASHVDKSGSSFTGDIAKIVIVKTDPNHAGSGTIVATLPCQP